MTGQRIIISDPARAAALEAIYDLKGEEAMSGVRLCIHRTAEAMQPKMLIPVHGEAWERYQAEFNKLHVTKNGEYITLED